ncbi:MAG: zinc transporter [Desulfobacter sp.]|nr:MAG: zinc transporter [Desulfobacter sp.]
MSHDHTHTHSHSHDHDHSHDHAHTHSHDHSSEMSMEDKLKTLFAHWIDHNDSHKDNFVSWAKKAREAGLDAAADALEEAGSLSQEVTEKLRQARASIEG